MVPADPVKNYNSDWSPSCWTAPASVEQCLTVTRKLCVVASPILSEASMFSKLTELSSTLRIFLLRKDSLPSRHSVGRADIPLLTV